MSILQRILFNIGFILQKADDRAAQNWQCSHLDDCLRKFREEETENQDSTGPNQEQG